MRDDLASLNEDLSAEPVQAELQALLRSLIARGTDPGAIADAVLATAAAFSLDVRGAAKTGAMLEMVGSNLLRMSLEYREAVAKRTGKVSHH